MTAARQTAGSSGDSGGSEPGGGAAFARVPDSGRRAALALLLTGRARESDPAVDQFLAYALSQGMETDQLWSASRAGQAVAAALIVPAAGRAGMVFVSPLQSDDQAGCAAGLLRVAAAAQDPTRFRIIQALLDPPQRRERDALASAGFNPLATLLYMQRGATGVLRQLDAGPGIQVLHWNPSRRELFARAILASYEQTLDCPGLLGLRHIDDIISGHMATGQFVPELWHLLHHGDEPVGLMLLNLMPQRRSMELVYLGLSVPWRGRRLGKVLLEHALALAPHYGASELILAVDENNAPALALYRGLRFLPNARKIAMLRALP